jgi:hypothetical protein
MQHYHGSCHCGAVRFEIDAPIERVVQCNCSICRKKGALHHAVEPSAFRLTCGADQLGTYTFGTGEAKHHFCLSCGIHVFARPRGAPHLYSVNVRTLDDFPTEPGLLSLVQFDGQDWEEAIARPQHPGS